MQNTTYIEELHRYIEQIKGCKRITKIREKQLAKVIADSENEIKKSEAINELVEANLTLVIDIVIRRTQNFYGLASLMDFISIGNMALLRAANSYKGDHASGASFGTLAYSYINNAITTAMQEDKFIRVPENYYYILGAIKKFERKNGREPSSKELAKVIKIKASRIEEVRKNFADIAVFALEAFNISRGEGADKTWEEMVGKEDHKINRSLVNIDLQEFVKKLTPKYQMIIQSLYLGEQITVEELAKRMGVTKQLISFNSIRALRSLRCKIMESYDRQHKSHTHILTARNIDSINRIKGHKEYLDRLAKEEIKNAPIYKKAFSEYMKELI